MSILESDVEQELLGWFEDLGYEVVFGPDLAPDGMNPERKSYKHVLLDGRLKDALHRLNPGMPPAAIADAMGVLTNASTPDCLLQIGSFNAGLLAAFRSFGRRTTRPRATA